MSDSRILVLKPVGLPDDLIPGETVPNMIVATRVGTMVLYVTEEEDHHHVYATFGPTDKILLACTEVWTMDRDGENKRDSFDASELALVWHGLYVAFFREKYLSTPTISQAMMLGKRYQTPQEAMDAHTLLEKGIREQFKESEILMVRDSDDFDIDRWAEETWLAFDNETVGDIGDHSAFDTFIEGDEFDGL